MPSLLELRNELRELRKTTSPKPISQMRKDDLLAELERNRMMSKFIDYRQNEKMAEKNEMEKVAKVVMAEPLEEKPKAMGRPKKSSTDSQDSDMMKKKKTPMKTVKTVKPKSSVVVEDEKQKTKK